MNSASEPKWQLRIIYPRIPVKYYGWLIDSDSFIKKLHLNGIEDISLVILNEGWSKPYPSESRVLNLDRRENSWIREVLIKNSDKKFMYARTVFPLKTLTGEERQFCHLKERSLGSVIFRYPHLIRTPFEIAFLKPNSSWFKKISHFVSMSDSYLWARRSQFIVHQKKILLSEVFLPDVFC